MKSTEEAMREYHDLLHAMQSGVAYEHSKGSTDGSPKHLRTGINSAHITLAAIAGLLIAKGIITDEEYVNACRDEAENEVRRYELRANGGDPNGRIRFK